MTTLPPTDDERRSRVRAFLRTHGWVQTPGGTWHRLAKTVGEPDAWAATLADAYHAQTTRERAATTAGTESEP